MKKSPATYLTMATQHPDHAGKPYWHDEPFIPTLKEARNVFMFFGFGHRRIQMGLGRETSGRISIRKITR